MDTYYRGKELIMELNRKPKIGLLGIMHGLYDEKQPEITVNQEQWARELVGRLEGSADITFPGAAKSREHIEKYMHQFNAEGYDGTMIVMMLYSPGFRLVRALQENNLPLLLTNIQPLPEVTKDWNWNRLTTNQGIHGAQDTANMIIQSGTKLSVKTEDWTSDRFLSCFTD